MITEKLAQTFADNWISAWNSHDLENVISHYADNVEYYSPFLLKLTDNKTGMLQGKEAVKEYLAKGLQAYPDLYFKLNRVFVGINSITLQYQSVNDLNSAEVFELDSKGLITRVQCHYFQT